MASGDEKAASQAGHMAAPTSNANAQLTLAKGEPSTQGAKRRTGIDAVDGSPHPRER
jgi:hypothetical protein